MTPEHIGKLQGDTYILPRGVASYFIVVLTHTNTLQSETSVTGK